MDLTEHAGQKTQKKSTDQHIHTKKLPKVRERITLKDKSQEKTKQYKGKKKQKVRAGHGGAGL